MGDGFVQTIVCPFCEAVHLSVDIVYFMVAVPGGFKCGACRTPIDLGVETGITYEEACEQAHTETLVDALRDTYLF